MVMDISQIATFIQPFTTVFISLLVADRYRYRMNWSVIYMVTLLNGINPFIQIPSLHQYITSSSNHSQPNIEPGLELSETWYSIIVSMGSIGTFIGACGYALSSRYIYVKAGIIVELIIALAGGLLYSFSFNGWTVLVSRLLTGIFTGIHMSLMRAYVFETSTKLIEALPADERNKSTIKYTAVFLLLFHGVLGRALAPAIVAVAAQFSSISEFHLPGYYISAHSFLLIILVALTFNERWNDVVRVRKQPSKSLKQRLLLDIKTPAIPHYLSLVFVYLFLILGWNLSIIETLQNPILSDQFGLDVKTTSYVFIGVLSVYFISLVIMYFFQKLRFDNRLILILSLMVGVAGTVIMIDWQSIGGDPCNNNITTQGGGPNVNSSYYCEQFGENNSFNCFWNPDSRVTGDYCERCRPVCLSESHSLNFVQLLVGLSMISFCLIPGRVLVTTIASDIAMGQSVSALMGGLVAAGAISQASGPIWRTGPLYGPCLHRGRGGTTSLFMAPLKRRTRDTSGAFHKKNIFKQNAIPNRTNLTYQAIGRHTWLPMSILTVGQTIAIILLLILYRRMSKKVTYVVLTESNGNHEHIEQEYIEEEQLVEDSVKLLTPVEDDDSNDSLIPQ